jgi:ankyrin repeat protein
MQKIIKSIDNRDQVEALLIQYKSSENDFINEKDKHGDSLLHFASRIHCIPVMELLIQLGADPEAVNEHGNIRAICIETS